MRARCLPLAAVLLAIATTARAQAVRLEDLTYEAGEVEADPSLKRLVLRHHVVVVYKRYRLESEELTLRLTPRGLYVDGSGRVAFCPCSDPPVTIAFSRARVAPPGELLLTFPRVEIEHVPALFLPWVWIRSPDRVGLLPPQLAWRGDDGFFAGAGVHLPWHGADSSLYFVDLSAGGYVEGGAEVAARAETRTSTTHAVWDRIHGDRVLVDTHGAMGANASERVAWDLDAIRGPRARSGTIDLEPAARPFDVGAAETSARIGPALLATGIAARATRGEGRIVAGPESSVGIGGALGSSASWDFGASGVALGNDVSGAAVPIAAADTGVDVGTQAGPLAIALESREMARIAGRGAFVSDTEPSEDALASAGARVGLPIARAWRASESGEPRAPLVHYVTPELEGRVAVAATRGSFFATLRRPLAPVSWTSDAGLWSALGRYGGGAARLEARAGAYGRSDRRPLPVAHGRLRAGTSVIGLGVEAAAVGTSSETAAPLERAGLALIGRARFGPEQGPNLGVEAATEAGEDARDARSIADGTATSLPMGDLAYLVEDGTTGAASVRIPWTSSLMTYARVDADLDAREIVGVRGDLAYRHSCGCLAIDLSGARRIGRGGFDVWLTVDLGPPPRAH